MCREPDIAVSKKWVRNAPTPVIVNVGSVPELQQLLNPGQTVLSMNTNQKTISVCGLLSRNSRERARI
jgi:hypothetical protein